MIVVSDSTPLITLMKAGRLNILEGLFGEVLIPEAVYSEVTDNQAFRDEAELIRSSDYIRIVRADDRERVSFLQSQRQTDRRRIGSHPEREKVGAL